MLVTRIERTKRGRFSVYIDGEFFCALHPDVFALSGLGAGSEVDPGRMEEWRGESEERIARERALRLLSRRAYTEKGLYDKLREHAGERHAAAAVARMKELGLVDDADYARRYAAEVMETKGFSKLRVARELARRGVGRETADAALGELEDDPQAAIARVVLRKYMRHLGDEKGVAKTVGALVRLGYRYDDIRAVVGNLMEDEEYYNANGSG